MTRILFPEFRDDNAASRYPFADSATLMTTTGLQFPVDMILDAAVYPVVGNDVGMRLTKIVVADTEVTLVIGNSTNTWSASGTFDKITPPTMIELVDTYSRPAGVLICDATELAIFQVWPLGSHLFAATAAAFVAAVTFPVPATGVRGLMTPDQNLFTGDVWLVGDDGVVIRAADDNTVRIDIVGDPLFVRRVCGTEADLFETPKFLQTINGEEADEYGNYTILVTNDQAADTVLRVFAQSDSSLRIEVEGTRIANATT